MERERRGRERRILSEKDGETRGGGEESRSGGRRIHGGAEVLNSPEGSRCSRKREDDQGQQRRAEEEEEGLEEEVRYTSLRDLLADVERGRESMTRLDVSEVEMKDKLLERAAKGYLRASLSYSSLDDAAHFYNHPKPSPPVTNKTKQ
eukprot:c25307_g10_i1 orf=2-442(-)